METRQEQKDRVDRERDTLLSAIGVVCEKQQIVGRVEFVRNDYTRLVKSIKVWFCEHVGKHPVIITAGRTAASRKAQPYMGDAIERVFITAQEAGPYNAGGTRRMHLKRHFKPADDLSVKPEKIQKHLETMRAKMIEAAEIDRKKSERLHQFEQEVAAQTRRLRAGIEAVGLGDETDSNIGIAGYFSSGARFAFSITDPEIAGQIALLVKKHRTDIGWYEK